MDLKKVTLPVTSWPKSRTNLGQFLLRLALITGYFCFVFFKGFYSMVYSIFICMVLPFFSASCSFLSWRQLPQCVCRQLGHCSGCRLQQMHYSVEREEGLSKQFPETFKQLKDFKVDIMRHIMDFCLFPFLFSILQVYNSIKIAVFPIVSFAIFSGIFSGKDISRLDLCTGGILLRYHTGIH